LPEEPNEVLALIETAGRSGQHTFGTSLPAVERPRMRIISRGEPNDYETPRAQIESVYQLFAARGNGAIGAGARYLTFEPLQPPYVLGRDKNDRWMLGFNVEVWKEVSAL
jgi:hypothetical protein